MALPEVLREISLRVDLQAIRAYAELTGDFNPIHVDPEFAAKTPMGGVIAHSTLSLNLIWQSLAATLEADAVRFAKPVRVGDEVVAAGKRLPNGGYEVWVRNAQGDAVIDGLARLS